MRSIGSVAFEKCINLEKVYCLAENVPTTGSDAFKDSYIDYCTLYVPEGSVESYKTTEPWNGFGKIVVKICESPVTKFVNGKITCSSATPHALCHYLYNVTNSSGSGYNGADVTMKMEISAYATAEGYANSDTVTETFNLNAGSGLKGDVNGDSKVTMQDANEVMNIYLGK